MAQTDDHSALAAEYVLGTLDAQERAQVDLMMAVDDDFRRHVERWELALGSLNQMVGAIEPRPELWERIRAATRLPQQSQSTQSQPQQSQPVVADTAIPPVDTGVGPVELPPDAVPVVVDAGARDELSNVVPIRSRATRWRPLALVASAIAAVLAIVVALQVVKPEALPGPLRPAPRVQVVQVQAPARPQGAQFVALLQGSASAPAFIMTVDVAAKTFTVRRVGAESEPGKSYELWLVSDKLEQPRSLGVIGSAEFTRRSALANFDPAVVDSATYAVSIEPEGGSPTGVATGPIVYTGKLVQTVPAAP